MNYIAHRGLWKEKNEQNTYVGIKRALDLGFGVELDIRDNNGELIVSHDPGHYIKPLLFQEILELFKSYDSTLAINVKSDGIVMSLKSMLTGLDASSYFLFDMSIPETIVYLENGLPTYMRVSEYESFGELHKRSDGVWLDAFQADWWVGASDVFSNQKNVCVVSPELHGRDYSDAWSFLRTIDSTAQLFICTDQPESAKVFFE